MKEINYNDYVKLARSRYAPLRARVENQFKGRVARQRPRDAKKESLLLAMDKRRWEEALRQGRIQILGKRTVRFNVTSAPTS